MIGTRILSIQSSDEEWDFSNTSLDVTYSLPFSIIGEYCFFRENGLNAYLTDADSSVIYQCALSSAWDITTISKTSQATINVDATQHQGFFFNPSGTKLYTGEQTTDKLYEFSLSSAWDITTISSSAVNSFTFGGDMPNPTDRYRQVKFNGDGTKLFILASYFSLTQRNDILHYNLSTGWDISTAVFFTSEQLGVVSGNADVHDFIISPSGKRCFLKTNTTIKQYAMLSWDITTLTFDLDAGINYGAFGFFVGKDGEKLYIPKSVVGTDYVRQYSLN